MQMPEPRTVGKTKDGVEVRIGDLVYAWKLTEAGKPDYTVAVCRPIIAFNIYGRPGIFWNKEVRYRVCDGHDPERIFFDEYNGYFSSLAALKAYELLEAKNKLEQAEAEIAHLKQRIEDIVCVTEARGDAKAFGTEREKETPT